MIQLLIVQIQTKNIYNINTILFTFQFESLWKTVWFSTNTTPGFTSPMIDDSMNRSSP